MGAGWKAALLEPRREAACLEDPVQEASQRGRSLGRGKRPSLRSDRVQQATDGEIFWLLKNGNLPKGMPTWATIPEPMRWQVIAFVKSLGPAGDAAEKR